MAEVSILLTLAIVFVHSTLPSNGSTVPTSTTSTQSLQNCSCTGNGGYYRSRPKLMADGKIRQGYDFPPSFGESCQTLGAASFAFQGRRWSNESWCHIPCDKSICTGIPRHPSHMLWAAKDAGVELCYSFEMCGGVDHMTQYQNDCLAKGGYITSSATCSCELVGFECKKTSIVTDVPTQDYEQGTCARTLGGPQSHTGCIAPRLPKTQTHAPTYTPPTHTPPSNIQSYPQSQFKQISVVITTWCVFTVPYVLATHVSALPRGVCSVQLHWE